MRKAIGGAAAMVVVVTIGLALASGGTRADAPTRAAVVEPSASDLSIRLVGNAGVALSDGETSLMVDLPYEPGAFGYMHYDAAALRPTGTVVAVITHDHRDHFAAELFLTRADWRVIGPPSVTAALPPDRVVTGDTTSIGAFAVVALPSPHTDDHRSYRIRWRGRVLHFTGDTEDPTSVPSEPRLDMLFVTPWLSCSLPDRAVPGARIVAYHLQPDGTDRLCGSAEPHEQGTELSLTPRAS
jgi:glyoxylase-like metal-dependent hydrolase (beta-lactamase superfamily II)